MEFSMRNKACIDLGNRTSRLQFNFSSLLLGMLALLASANTAMAQPNMFINQAEIDAIKLKVDAGEAPWTDAYNTVLSRAGTALNTPLQSVTYQGIVFGNIQWYQTDDHPAAITMSDSVRTLGLAYAFTDASQQAQRAAYADKAIDFIRTWTLDSVTRMRPTPPGKTIDNYVTMPSMFYGADLISDYGGWDPGEKTAFYDWTRTMANYFVANGEGNNNFSNWRYLTIASAGALLNDTAMFDFAESEFKRLLPIQVQNQYSSVAGRMNYEVGRDDGLHYSLFAINAMIQTAEILYNRGVNVYDYVDPNTGSSLKLALDFITPYALNPETWGNTSETTGLTQLTPIAQRNSMALFELAYSYYQDPAYLAVVNRWERPMYENRIMGINTLTHANTFELAIAPGLDGDFDLDDDVDGADFLRWQRDGLSGSALADWEANFGTSLPVASTSVPEPSAGLMLLVGCGICAMRRRRATPKGLFRVRR